MEQRVRPVTSPGLSSFFTLVNNPVKFRFYLLKNLPAAAFSGLKIKNCSAASCVVTVPYKWFTKNPFRSTYFACLSMAAELSTGVLAMAHVYRRAPGVSMLVVGLEAKFYKKATGSTVFECVDGDRIAKAIEDALLLDAPQELTVCSTGKNSAGEPVATFWITWSFKAKNR